MTYKYLIGLILAFLIVGAGYIVAEQKTGVPDSQLGEKAATDQIIFSSSSVPADWKTYSNDKFGFSFKYPPTSVVCEIPQFPPGVIVPIIDDGIDLEGKDCASVKTDISIHVDNTLAEGGDTKDDQNLRNDFFKDFGGIDPSLNPDLGYFNLDGFRAFGGVVRRPTPDKSVGVLEYIVLINQGGHRISFWDRHFSDHEKDSLKIIGSLEFSESFYKR